MMIPNNILKMLPQGIQGLQSINTPDELAQILLNSGKVNQMQVNQAKQLWNQPNIRQMIQNKYQY